MGKGGGGRRQKKDTKTPKIRTDFTEEDMDDEIDAFHKQRDIVPLDVDDDTDSSDEDGVQPVYDLEGLDDDDEDDDDDDEDDGFVAKIAKQQQIMRRKTGGVEDETHDDAEEDEKKDKLAWSRRNPYGGDNVDYELQSSDEDLPAEEEAEVLRLQKEKAELYSMEDFGLEDNDQADSASDGEKTLEDILPKTRARSKPQEDKGTEDDNGTAYEVKKDLNALSQEEQMDVVYSSAPELVGLLSELKDALDQLENKVNPLISKVKKRNGTSKEELHYLETKQLLLLAYCQAISFYLLLKSEGHPVRDHPVIARLVEIKNLLDKMKQIDDKLPSEPEEFLNQERGTDSGAKRIEKTVALTSEPVSKENGHSPVSIKTRAKALRRETAELAKTGFSEENGNKQENCQPKVGLQSMEMLKVRATLEEKLKQKGILSSVANKLGRNQKSPLQPMNSQLETMDDFDDEVIDKQGGNANLSNGRTGSMHSSKLLKLVAAKFNKSKAVSGDDDMPKRDDIGERRRKHEMRVLANAGVESNDEDKDDPEGIRGMGVKSVDADVEEDGETEESEDDFYKQVKRQRTAKQNDKDKLYSRTPVASSLAEPDIVDGKRQINRQIEKNRGLTRARKKEIKNPRKKYKLKHQKAEMRRKGQVREVKKPMGPYGGETSGINAGISRSRRFNN